MTDDRRDGRSQSDSDDRRSLDEDIRDRARRHRRSPSPGIVIAVLMIGIGGLLFLDNIGLFHFYDVWRFWPVALIAIGISKMFESRGVGGRVWAAMLMFAGTAFLLDNLGVWHASWNVIWPLAIIGMGVIMLINALERRPAPSFVKTSSGDTSSYNTLREWVTFGGLKRRLDTPNFQGGEMIAVFGGIEVDLRRAQIASTDKEVIIDANATFGGIDLKVPETWQVVTRGLGIFGGYEDKTQPPKEESKRLVIRGLVIMGGIEVTN